MSRVARAFAELLEAIRAERALLAEEHTAAVRDGDDAAEDQLSDALLKVRTIVKDLQQLQHTWEASHAARRAPAMTLGHQPALGRPLRVRNYQGRKHGVGTSKQAFRLPILRALEALGGTAHKQEVMPRVEASMKDTLVEADYEVLAVANEQRWFKTCSWCKQDLVSDGLLDNRSPRGHWRLTDAGRELLRSADGEGSDI